MKTQETQQLILVWTNSLAPDGWDIGYADPPTFLEPRESKEMIILIKAPLNQPASDTIFELGVYATIDNGFETLQVASTYPVNVESGSHCSIDYDQDARPLLGIERDGSASQKVTVINIGNMPLDATLSAELDANGWGVELSESTISGLGVGLSQEIEITAEPSENSDAGIEDLVFTCGANSIRLEVSVENRQTQGGLFGILPVWAASSILGAIVLVGLVLARRIKKSAPKGLSGEELIAPDAHSNPDDGLRMQAMMKSVVGEESLASGGVSAEEIADALAQSIPSLPIPGAPAVVPLGRPPSAIPSGRPPAATPQGRPPAIAQQPVVVQPPKVPAGPPLPPSGLPPGWSMEQWQHYGHQWLAQQGQQ